jgi:hypothetical protein
MALVTASSVNFDLAQQHHVIGYYIYDNMERDVAGIRNLLVDQQTHVPRYAVIEIGGMLSIAGKKLLIPWKALKRGGISRLNIGIPSEQIQSAPLPLSQMAPTRVEEESIHLFFKVEPYWFEELEKDAATGKDAAPKKRAPLEAITEKLVLERDARK